MFYVFMWAIWGQVVWRALLIQNIKNFKNLLRLLKPRKSNVSRLSPIIVYQDHTSQRENVSENAREFQASIY